MEAVRDLVIIGAGPAGLSAAAEAREHELDVLVLDEQPEPGGQVYRSAARVVERRPADIAFLGADYARGAGLVAGAMGVERRQGATVWQIGPADGAGVREVVWSEAGTARRVATRGSSSPRAGGADWSTSYSWAHPALYEQPRAHPAPSAVH